ncbi:hypothetical protein BaRGS_00027145, partial [Batillaria attramentaria]
RETERPRHRRLRRVIAVGSLTSRQRWTDSSSHVRPTPEHLSTLKSTLHSSRSGHL